MGFSLIYDDYHTYDSLLTINPAQQLCNTLPYTSFEPDPYDCVESAMGRAVSNGLASYNVYIATERQLFRASYISTCKAAQANANLVEKQQNYHYTLYYYDQADNLVRTVPPEGVTLVDTTKFAAIDQARDNDTLAYTYNGPITNSSKSAALLSLSQTLQLPVGAVEMSMYNGGANRYHFIGATPDRKYLFQAGIAGNTLSVDVFPLYQNSADTTKVQFVPATGHYQANISALQPLPGYVNIVFQGSNLGAGTNTPQLYLDSTALAVSTNTPGSPLSFSISAAAGKVNYPDSIQHLQHLRLYNHLLSQATITADFKNTFFAAADLSYTGWYRFNMASAPKDGNSNITKYYDLFPAHVLNTTYAYNGTNQVTQQNSPDGGTNRFWYDLLSRLTISQNDKQLAASNYSYTAYDQLGRITEVGQKNLASTTIGSPDYVPAATLQTFNTAGSNSQITNTYYDVPVPTLTGNTNGIATLPGQSNLRKRVAASSYTETQGGPVLRATYYNYDLDGNVKTLWQQIDGLYQNSSNTGLKRIDYEFDLVSGKVNFVRYQDGQPDAFYYKYEYDAANRLTAAYSSPQALVDTLTGSYLPDTYRKLDADYYYYLHGPLQRMELGDVRGKVQGIDYTYTLQGWLKGVNSTAATPTADMGQDGAAVARDAFGYSLGYFTGDYNPIGGASSYPAFALQYTPNAGDITGQPLYNGNISNATVAIGQLNGGAPVGYSYHYDQLNRLKTMRQHSGITGTSWDRHSITPNYQENITYDGNGNILSYGRNGAAPTAQTIDSLTYNYARATGRLVNNQLQSINDAVASSNYSSDLSNQTNATNYRYDAIGNLIYDAQSGITGNDGVNSITWSVYGKIQTIYKTTGAISYTYNPSGERVSKTVAGLTTWYVRDAQGNTLALYDNKNSNVNWREQHLYGSSRLGIWTPNVNLSNNNAFAVWDTIGRKQYELTNHLGNVLATITDKRVQHTTNNTAIDYYLADVATAQDYYPFGMLEPGRQYTFTANGVYRYGFNGKENDNDVGKGTGNQQDYGARIYDTRVGKFLSVDPLQKQYPGLSAYQFANNSPIDGTDLDGRERIDFRLTIEANGAPRLTKLSESSTSGWFTNNIFQYQKIPEFYRIEFEGQHYVFVNQANNPNGDSNFVISEEGGTPIYPLQYLPNFFSNPKSFTSVEQSQVAETHEMIVNNLKMAMLSMSFDFGSEGIPNTPPTSKTDEAATSANAGNQEAVTSNTASKSPKFNPNKPALTKEKLDIKPSINGGAPTFEGTPHLYPVNEGQNNIVQVKLTGSYSKDFVAANKAANLVSTPKGYTWHHMDDFNSTNGTSTLQLVKSDIHTATIPHTGSVKQYETANNTTYKP